MDFCWGFHWHGYTTSFRGRSKQEMLCWSHRPWCLMGSRRKIVKEKGTSCTTLNGPRLEDTYTSHSVLCTMGIYMDLKQFGQLCFVNWMSLWCHLPNSGSWWNLRTPWAKSSFETFWPSWWRRASWTSMVLAAWWISGMPPRLGRPSSTFTDAKCLPILASPFLSCWSWGYALVQNGPD